jgi:hypothetical protein
MASTIKELLYLLWHADLLLGNYREIRNYETTFTKQRPINSNRRNMFSVQSTLRYYKQGQLAVQSVIEGLVESVSELVRKLLSSIVVSCCCEKVVTEVGDSSGTQRKGNVRRWKPLPTNG